MARKVQYIVELTEEEKSYLRKNTNAGKWGVRKVKRGRILLKADKGINENEIAKELRCSVSTVRNIKLRFAKGERLEAVEEKARSGRPRIIDGEVEAKIIAIACSEAPEGRKDWTIRLITDKLVTLVDELESISFTAVGKALKKTKLNRG
jgi:transposase